MLRELRLIGLGMESFRYAAISSLNDVQCTYPSVRLDSRYARAHPIGLILRFTVVYYLSQPLPPM